jgi:hypothetical protein
MKKSLLVIVLFFVLIIAGLYGYIKQTSENKPNNGHPNPPNRTTKW